MEKTKYKIGEFSKLARVTVRTLRHYSSAKAIESKIRDCETRIRDRRG